MRSLVKRAVAPVALVVLLTACGGSDSSDTVASGGSGDETTTTGATSDTTETTVTSTTTEGPSTSTGNGGRTVTTKSPPVTPGPPRTGPLTTPPTVRPIDPYLPPGVVDQVTPPGTLANELLSKRKCGALLRQIRGPITERELPTTVSWKEGSIEPDLTNLYLAAGEVCLSNWAAAAAAFRQVSTANLCPVDPEDPEQLAGITSFESPALCRATRGDVYRWTERLLRAKAANPAFVPNFQPPPER